MNNNLLILGASGFFGKAILEYIYQKKTFYKKKFDTITLLSRRSLVNYKLKNKLKKQFKIICLKKNILSLKELPNAKYIIYCALLKNLKKDYLAVKHFSKILKKNNNSSKIIFTSSGAVYGEWHKKQKPVKENLINNGKFNFSDNNKNLYAYYKLKSELIFKKLSSKNFKISILRCFAFVGKNLPRNKNFAIGDYINNILQLKTIIMKSKCNVVRSFMHQDDLANWILTILLNNKKKISIYNVGSNYSISLYKLGLLLSAKFKINFKSKNEFFKNTDYYVPNIEKVIKNFNLKLKYNSLSAIYKTIEQIKENK